MRLRYFFVGGCYNNEFGQIKDSLTVLGCAEKAKIARFVDRPCQLFCWNASLLGRLVEQKHLNRTHLSSSVGARPSSGAPSTRTTSIAHTSSSVGARPSSAAPVHQNHLSSTPASSSVRARPSSGAPDQQNHLVEWYPLNTPCFDGLLIYEGKNWKIQLHKRADPNVKVIYLGRGGRGTSVGQGRPRMVRPKSFRVLGLGLLFDGVADDNP